MKLEISVCYTMLEKIFSNLSSFGGNNENTALEEIKRRKIVLSEKLEEFYEEYFKKNDLLDFYGNFYSQITLMAESSKVIMDITNYRDYDDFIIKHCENTTDKILFTEKNLSNQNIDVYNLDRIVDKNSSNMLNDYRVPIVSKQICTGECSKKLSKYLGKFINDFKGNKILIVDPYFYSNINDFEEYILPYIPYKKKIEIYTNYENNITEKQYKYAVGKPNLKKNYDISLYIVEDKKDIHDRYIWNGKYFINIGRGLNIFGELSEGKTKSSFISISYKSSEDMKNMTYSSKKIY